MQRLVTATKNKPQLRTKATKSKILDAAEALFAEQGFENTQLDQVAARAGCSRGAIYAHYTNKEDVFLALVEHRVHTKFVAVCNKIKDESDMSKRRGIFKRWIVSQVSDSSWSSLTLEYELYAVRRPESRERLVSLYEALFTDNPDNFAELLFGKDVPKVAGVAMDRRLAVLAGALNGMVLENQFRVGFIPASHLKLLAEEIFDALIHI